MKTFQSRGTWLTAGVVSLMLWFGARAGASEGLGLIDYYTGGRPPAISGFAANGVAVSPDGVHAYAAGGSQVMRFVRDQPTGLLSDPMVLDMPAGISLGRDVITSDGLHLYAVSGGGGTDGVLHFTRNPTTGVLTHIGTYENGVGGVTGVGRAHDLVLSSDETSVYVAGSEDNAIAVFERNVTTGVLTFVEAKVDGVGGVSGLQDVHRLAIAPDGLHVYTLSEPAGPLLSYVTTFTRNPGTGALTFVETIQKSYSDGAYIAVSPDGMYVYANDSSASIAIFSRDSGTGVLNPVAVAFTINSGRTLLMSPDGSRVYVAGGTRTQTFSRDGLTGLLSDQDVEVTAVGGPESQMALSPDGKFLYGGSSSKLLVFQRVLVSCSDTPAIGCLTPSARGARLSLTRDPSFAQTKNKAKFTWKTMTPVANASFGDPTTSTDYAICIYDSSPDPQPVRQLLAPAGNICKTRDCWKASPGGGAKYTDPLQTPNGLASFKLGPKKITWSAKSMFLDSVPVPATAPLRVQIQTSNAGCFDSTFSTVTMNGPVVTRLTATSD